MAVNIVITDAGRAEIINAENTGTAPVTIAEIGVGTGQYTPLPTQTALQSETKRLTTFAGDGIGDDIIHLSIRDESSDAYLVYEFGLYTQSGTLFAVYSQASTPIINKTATSILLLAVDVALKTINPTSLTFGSTDFLNPPATTETQGVVQLATQAETNTGSNALKALTPATLAGRTATASRTGIIALSSQAEAEAGTNNTKAMTPLRTAQHVTNRLATEAETQTGTNNTKAVTPAGLSSRTATTTRTGLVELPTQAEAEAATDNERAMTPLRTKQQIDNRRATQAEAEAGDNAEKLMTPQRTSQHVTNRLATNAETQAGTNNTKMVTPAGLSSRTATTARTGLVELPTQAEAEGEADNERAMTPLRTKQQIDNRRATQAEAEAGEDNTKLMTPQRTAQAARQVIQDDVIDVYELEPRITVKPTIDLDFRNNEYTVWQDDANSFTKLPLADAIGITNGGGTLVRPTGLIGSVGANIGRLTTVNGRQGLLVEEAATNYFWPSEDLSGSNWIKSNVTLSAAGPSPIDDVDFEKVEATAGSTSTRLLTANSTPGTTHFISFFVGNHTPEVNVLVTPSSTNAFRVNVSLTNELINTSSGASELVVERCTNGRRFIVKTESSGALDNASVLLTRSSSTLSVANADINAGDFVEITGLMSSTLRSSYIPTTTSAVTRVADNPVRELGDEFNPREGAIFVECIVPKYTDFNTVLGFGSANTEEIRFGYTNPSAFGFIFRAGSTQLFSIASVPPIGSSVRMALAYQTLSTGEFLCKPFLNGVKLTERTLERAPTGFGDAAGIGKRRAGATSLLWNGVINEVGYRPKALPDAQLIALTKGAN